MCGVYLTGRQGARRIVDRVMMRDIICADYIYFNSLAWFGRRNGVLAGGEAKDRPVLFFHVPAESDVAALERGTVGYGCIDRGDGGELDEWWWEGVGLRVT